MESRSVICYPQPNKDKSLRILEAFAAGCGGRIARGAPPVLEPGAAAFWGVVGMEHLLRLARAEGREFYYGDNAFFDVARGRYYRFARNALQVSKLGAPDHDRARRLGLSVKPWRRGGEHIIVIEQSEQFMKIAGLHPLWTARVVAELRQHTDRPVRIRKWTREKLKAGQTLSEDLKGAWALVTHASAAANEAVLAGVPVFVGSKECAAAPMASGALSSIESPRLHDGREVWAAWLASMQWTMEELRQGKAWAALQS